MANNPYRGWQVRGFWTGSKAKLVLVKGSKTELINVRSAEVVNGKWIFTTLDGANLTLPKARKKIQYLKKAEIVTNCVDVYDGIDYDRVGGDYSKLELWTDEYRVACFKRYFLRKKIHISSPIYKIWKEKGRYHVLTMSGAHYVFPIK